MTNCIGKETQDITIDDTGTDPVGLSLGAECLSAGFRAGAQAFIDGQGRGAPARRGPTVSLWRQGWTAGWNSMRDAAVRPYDIGTSHRPD